MFPYQQAGSAEFLPAHRQEVGAEADFGLKIELTDPRCSLPHISVRTGISDGPHRVRRIAPMMPSHA